MKTFFILTARLLSGSLFLIVVWVVIGQFELFDDVFPLVLSFLAGLVLSFLVSLLGNAIGLRQRTYPAVFAIPFLLPIVISSLAIPESIFRPFLFWSVSGIITLTLALTADVLTRRLFRRGTDS